MAKTALKEEFVGKMQKDVARAAGVIFLDYTGFTVAQANVFRSRLRAAKVHYQVVKNTLMARVLVDTPYSEITKCLAGTPTGVVLGFDDPVSAAKLTFDFMKECDKLRVKGGIVEQRAISAAETESLSKMPGRIELQGMIVAQAQSPGRNLQGQIKSSAGRIVGAVEALAKRLEEGADAPA